MEPSSIAPMGTGSPLGSAGTLPMRLSGSHNETLMWPLPASTTSTRQSWITSPTRTLWSICEGTSKRASIVALMSRKTQVDSVFVTMPSSIAPSWSSSSGIRSSGVTQFSASPAPDNGLRLRLALATALRLRLRLRLAPTSGTSASAASSSSSSSLGSISSSGSASSEPCAPGMSSMGEPCAQLRVDDQPRLELSNPDLIFASTPQTFTEPCATAASALCLSSNPTKAKPLWRSICTFDTAPKAPCKLPPTSYFVTGARSKAFPRLTNTQRSSLSTLPSLKSSLRAL
mmetsp:Transcript_109185/g.233329  ORF Transcript_109185/g.233329 Transcript_109185/m.233329 type:complete len:287 (+) Transcript_109185:278-1138(+)